MFFFIFQFVLQIFYNKIVYISFYVPYLFVEFSRGFLYYSCLHTTDLK